MFCIHHSVDVKIEELYSLTILSILDNCLELMMGPCVVPASEPSPTCSHQPLASVNKLYDFPLKSWQNFYRLSCTFASLTQSCYAGNIKKGTIAFIENLTLNNK